MKTRLQEKSANLRLLLRMLGHAKGPTLRNAVRTLSTGVRSGKISDAAGLNRAIGFLPGIKPKFRVTYGRPSQAAIPIAERMQGYEDLVRVSNKPSLAAQQRLEGVKSVLDGINARRGFNKPPGFLTGLAMRLTAARHRRNTDAIRKLIATNRSLDPGAQAELLAGHADWIARRGISDAVSSGVPQLADARWRHDMGAISRIDKLIAAVRRRQDMLVAKADAVATSGRHSPSAVRPLRDLNTALTIPATPPPALHKGFVMAEGKPVTPPAVTVAQLHGQNSFPTWVSGHPEIAEGYARKGAKGSYLWQTTPEFLSKMGPIGPFSSHVAKDTRAVLPEGLPMLPVAGRRRDWANSPYYERVGTSMTAFPHLLEGSGKLEKMLPSGQGFQTVKSSSGTNMDVAAAARLLLRRLDAQV